MNVLDRRTCAVVFGLFAAAIGGPLGAQTYTMARQVVASGAAAQRSVTGSMLNGTIGQSVVGVGTTSAARMHQGFWVPFQLVPSGVDDPNPQAPPAARIHVFPNPFTSSTAMSIESGESIGVRLTIHDGMGRPVRVLLDDSGGSPAHVMEWDGKDDSGSDVASGHYWYTLEVRARGRSGSVLRGTVTLLR